MLQQTTSRLYLIVSLVFPFFLSLSNANSLLYVQCSQPYFGMMTPYESNINTLFTSLVDSASISNFNKFEICPPEYLQSDIVYGLFQCRGDLSSSNCKDCVANSVSQLKTTCPLSTGGTIQLDECFVKYSNTSFFGVEDNMEVSKRCGPSIYDSNVLNRIDNALACLVVANKQYFRGGSFGSVQGVAQCVQDLTVNECEDCLLEARRRLKSECETSISGDMYLGKCYIRYEDRDNHSGDNDICDCNNDDNNHSRSKRKSKSTKIKLVRRWAITIGSIVGGVSSFTGLVVSLIILYKKRDKGSNTPIIVIQGSPRKKITEVLSPSPTPSSPHSPPPSGHYCNVVGGCTCPIPPPFAEAFYGARNEVHGIPWLSYTYI